MEASNAIARVQGATFAEHVTARTTSENMPHNACVFLLEPRDYPDFHMNKALMPIDHYCVLGKI